MKWIRKPCEYKILNYAGANKNAKEKQQLFPTYKINEKHLRVLVFCYECCFSCVRFFRVQ